MTDHKDKKMGNVIHMFEQGPDLPGVKVCSRCGEEKPATEEFFSRTRSTKNKGGFHNYCKPCNCEYQKDYRKRKKTGAAGSRAIKRASRQVAVEKACTHCCVIKPLGDFSTNNIATDGRTSWCKACYNQRQQKKLRRIHWTNRLKDDAVRRHKGRFEERSDITKEFLLDLYENQQGLCVWFRVPLELHMGSGPRQISLDRIDCSRGYMKDNVLLVCQAANYCRNDTPVEEFEIFLEHLAVSLKRRK